MKEALEEPTKIKQCRPNNINEFDQTNSTKEIEMTEGLQCDANLAQAEELNVTLGEEPIKLTSNDSVSPYSISNQTKAPTSNQGSSPGVSSFTGSSIFTFTKPIDTTTYWQPAYKSSSTSEGGVVIKPNTLYLEGMGSSSWPYAMSHSPPVSASLISEDTSSSSHPHHIHHLHHRPLHLHHYSNSPSQQPMTKDVTVELSDRTNSTSVGINNVITNTSTAVNARNDVTTYISSAYSNILQSTPRSNQPREDQPQPGHINMVGGSSDYMCSSMGTQEEQEPNANSSISFIRDNP